MPVSVSSEFRSSLLEIWKSVLVYIRKYSFQTLYKNALCRGHFRKLFFWRLCIQQLMELSLLLTILHTAKSIGCRRVVNWVQYQPTFHLVSTSNFCFKNAVNPIHIDVTLMTRFLSFISSKMLRPFIHISIPFIYPYNLSWKWKIIVLCLSWVFFLNVEMISLISAFTAKLHSQNCTLTGSP